MFSDGGMAERVLVPEYTLLSLPDGLDVRDACLIEPGAVAWHAVRRAGVRSGDRLLVLGGGSIGLLAAAAAQAAWWRRGCAQMVVAAVRSARNVGEGAH